MQNELINELAAANPNMVLIVISGDPCAVSKVINNVKGLLYACYPGQEGGRALADLLLGRENPSGKLPVTVPKNDGQLPACDTDFRTARPWLCGPWSKWDQCLGRFRPLENMSRDDYLFEDDGGGAYFISASDDNATLRMYRLGDDYLNSRPVDAGPRRGRSLQ